MENSRFYSLKSGAVSELPEDLSKNTYQQATSLRQVGLIKQSPGISLLTSYPRLFLTQSNKIPKH